MTEGKIERWHQTLKNRILLENYYLPDPAAQIEAFVTDYNHRRYHERIGNLSDAARQSCCIKRQTIALRPLQHQQQAA
jgi:putative transposase